ncbi:preprotein translocase subunit SecA [Brachybacterium ginsengisoli]|uniref:Preprotein translocase subunit SecA n=1 Tax=Brachybacterium ginsengisoli TaxID=1331682 RepID=A0A291GWL4_9MICO|nr:YchJ family protein [Brachybacterium ginsengisoli]ATG54484.1 preprotein translocase subunit SecA [Brachybacterium ginsengisoli]
MSTTPTPPLETDRCPCGSGDTFGACCGPVLSQQRRAATAQALMRSRYTAFATGDLEHLLRSWHPGTRPDREDLAASLEEDVRWLRLVIHETSAGGPFDDAGTVEFTAISRGPGGRQVLRELSRFVREGGAWLYVDGDVARDPG